MQVLQNKCLFFVVVLPACNAVCFKTRPIIPVFKQWRNETFTPRKENLCMYSLFQVLRLMENNNNITREEKKSRKSKKKLRERLFYSTANFFLRLFYRRPLMR